MATGSSFTPREWSELEEMPTLSPSVPSLIKNLIHLPSHLVRFGLCESKTSGSLVYPGRKNSTDRFVTRQWHFNVKNINTLLIECPFSLCGGERKKIIVSLHWKRTHVQGRTWEVRKRLSNRQASLRYYDEGHPSHFPKKKKIIVFSLQKWGLLNHKGP